MIAFSVKYTDSEKSGVKTMLLYAEDKEFALDQALYDIKENGLSFGPPNIISVEEDDDDMLYNLF